MSDANDLFKVDKEKKGKSDERLRDEAFKITQEYIEKSMDFRIEMGKAVT